MSQISPPDDRLLTTDEVARLLRVHPHTLRRWLRAGELRAVNLGGRKGWRIPMSAVDQFLDARRPRPA